MKMEKEQKKILPAYQDILLAGLLGIPIGAVIGGIDALFGCVLLWITEVRNNYPMYLIPFLALAGLLIVHCYSSYGGTSSQGMGLIFKVGHGEETEIPLRLVPFVMLGTWLTHLFGGSAGREGVAVQIGATVSHWVGKRLSMDDAPRIFLMTGMAAGFAGLFRTPMAAVAFGMEVLVAGAVEYRALAPALTASFTAAAVSGWLGLEKFTFAVTNTATLNGVLFWKLVGMGILFGLTGCAFAWLLSRAKQFFGGKLKNPMVRVAVMGACLSVGFLVLHLGRYSGLGTNLIHSSFYGEQIYPYDWIFKLILTILTLAAGYQGGEVTPLFSIGASLGVVLAGAFGVPVELAAALGYVSVFGSATNTFFAPVLIGAEVFGYQNLPSFFIVCAAAYAVNGNLSIYGGQRLNRNNSSPIFK